LNISSWLSNILTFLACPYTILSLGSLVLNVPANVWEFIVPDVTGCFLKARNRKCLDLVYIIQIMHGKRKYDTIIRNIYKINFFFKTAFATISKNTNKNKLSKSIISFKKFFRVTFNPKISSDLQRLAQSFPSWSFSTCSHFIK
jgi:hypothetical protein